MEQIKHVMRKLFTILCIVCGITYSAAKHITVTVFAPGTLENTIKNFGIWYSDITSLKIIGPIDSDDFVLIRYLAGSESESVIDQGSTYSHLPTPLETYGKLQVLDLSEATIKDSENYYYYCRSGNDANYKYDYLYGKTSENAISALMFCGCNSLKSIKWPVSTNCISPSILAYSSKFSSDRAIGTLPENIFSVAFGPNLHEYVDCGQSIIDAFCLSSIPFKGNWNSNTKVHVPKGKGAEYRNLSTKTSFIEGVLVQNFPDWASDNHDDNTTSSRTTKVHIPAGGTISFDYAVSSEEDCDYLTVTINGKKLVNKSGNASGTYTGTFDNEIIGDLVVKYSKDEMSAGGTDNASIKNMTLTMPENGYYEDSYMQIGCDNFIFFDCEHFDMFVDFVAPKLTYRRTFNNTEWQPLYVPFSIAYDEWQNDFEIARLNDIHQYDDNNDGEIDRTALEIVKLTSGRTEANTPYVIRAKSTGEKDLVTTNVKVSSIEGGGCMVSSWNTNFYFTGCYEPVSGTTMKNEGYYALGGGTLHQAASENSKLGSNRWYMEATDRYGKKLNLSEVKMFVFGEDEEDMETRVLEPKLDTECDGVFDMSGRKIAEKRDVLRPGIYIKNGKKYVVK